MEQIFRIFDKDGNGSIDFKASIHFTAQGEEEKRNRGELGDIYLIV